MSQQSDKAKWDALADMLGAKVSQIESPSPPQRESKVVPRIQLDLPPPPRKKADWDSLADDLGADAEQSPEPTSAPAPREPAKASRPHLEVVRPSDDPLPAENEHEIADATDGPLEFSDATWVDRETKAEDPGARADPAAGTDGERRPARRRRRRGGQRQRANSRERQPAAQNSERAEPDDDDNAEPVDVDDMDDLVDDMDDLDEPTDGHQQQERRESGRGLKRTGHKSVPSWSEAIAVMIDANMAGRTTRRPSRPNGGRTRGRRGGRRS